MKRRRFIAIAAAAVAAPATSVAQTRWQGLALGAEAQITLRGPGGDAALDYALSVLRAAESEFSLYRTDSSLSRLNNAGTLRPSSQFRALIELCDRLYRGTNGLFDPTVQTLWAALAKGSDSAAAAKQVGWDRVKMGGVVSLGPGQSLTLNGIAQGYVTDLVSAALAKAGFGETLVNIGEFRAGNADWEIGVSTPDGAMLDKVTLSQRALAVSSTNGTMIGGRSHILNARGRKPQWDTVAVLAPTAALADGLSTALCLAEEAEMSQIAAAFPMIEIRRWR
ncbi:FAD:protein FMN transferase [Primorskyibacter sp. 2E233]|uniref:FAD:protein FMN transferase n=1 Tax=Primorskyibacter sp. 2E233 TaxID=3413431 RepID=UPI0026F2EC7D|nr:FAD:protein FMN transferase [Donghicola eburneus]